MDTTRFQSAEWFSELKSSNITIGGAGSLGSWLALMLARTNPDKIIVFDMDTVEDANLGGQFFGWENVGRDKISALSDNIYQFSRYSIQAYKRYQRSDRTSHICFSCFDNMEARKDMFYTWLNLKPAISDKMNNSKLFIDCRLGFEYFQIFVVRPLKNDVEAYLDTLFNDDEVAPAPCSLKVNTFIPMMAASQMVAFYVNFLVNVKHNKRIREVPFSYEFHTDSLMKVITQSQMGELITWESYKESEYVTNYVKNRLDNMNTESKKQQSQETVNIEVIDDIADDKWEDVEGVNVEIVEEEEGNYEEFIVRKAKKYEIPILNCNGNMNPKESIIVITDLPPGQERDDILNHILRVIRSNDVNDKATILEFISTQFKCTLEHANVIYRFILWKEFPNLYKKYGADACIVESKRKERNKVTIEFVDDLEENVTTEIINDVP